MFVIVHRRDHTTGTSRGAGHAATASLRIHLGYTIHNGNGIVLTGLDTVAEAQATKFAGQWAVAAHLGGSQTIPEAFVLRLHFGALSLAFRIHATITGAANQRHLTGHIVHLDAHDRTHRPGAFGTTRGTKTDSRLAIEYRFGIAAAAGIAATAAICAGQTFIELIQTGIGLHIEDLGGSRQHQAKHQAQAAQNSNRNDNIHTAPSLKDLQAGEAHKSQGQQTGGDQRDGETLERTGAISLVHALTHGGKQHDG